MDRINGRIITSVLILTAAGIYRFRVMGQKTAAGRQITITRILVGGYILAIVASIIDLAGGQVGAIAGLLLALALLTALFTILPDLFARIGMRQNSDQGGRSGGHPVR